MLGIALETVRRSNPLSSAEKSCFSLEKPHFLRVLQDSCSAHATRCMAPAALHFASRPPNRVVFRVARVAKTLGFCIAAEDTEPSGCREIRTLGRDDFCFAELVVTTERRRSTRFCLAVWASGSRNLYFPSMGDDTSNTAQDRHPELAGSVWISRDAKHRSHNRGKPRTASELSFEQFPITTPHVGIRLIRGLVNLLSIRIRVLVVSLIIFGPTILPEFTRVGQ